MGFDKGLQEERLENLDEYDGRLSDWETVILLDGIKNHGPPYMEEFLIRQMETANMVDATDVTPSATERKFQFYGKKLEQDGKLFREIK